MEVHGDGPDTLCVENAVVEATTEARITSFMFDWVIQVRDGIVCETSSVMMGQFVCESKM